MARKDIDNKLPIYKLTSNLGDLNEDGDLNILDIVVLINFILDSNYNFSIQRDLPFLHFCQVSFYFSIFCIFYCYRNQKQIDWLLLYGVV